ncbi:MAG: porin family protein [Acinetobacter sp.]
MKKNLITVATTLLVCTTFSTAYAKNLSPLNKDDHPVYVSAKLGLGILSTGGVEWNDEKQDSIDRNDQKVTGSFAVGFDFSKYYDLPFRAELEYAHHSKSNYKQLGILEISNGITTTSQDIDINATTIQVDSFALNGYIDFTNQTKFSSFLTAGLGVAHLKVTDGEYEALNTSKSNFSWSVGAGIGYKVLDNLMAELAYRYTNFGDLSEIGTDEIKQKVSPNSQDITLGLRYNF